MNKSLEVRCPACRAPIIIAETRRRWDIVIYRDSNADDELAFTPLASNDPDKDSEAHCEECGHTALVRAFVVRKVTI